MTLMMLSSPCFFSFLSDHKQRAMEETRGLPALNTDTAKPSSVVARKFQIQLFSYLGVQFAQ